MRVQIDADIEQAATEFIDRVIAINEHRDANIPASERDEAIYDAAVWAQRIRNTAKRVNA